MTRRALIALLLLGACHKAPATQTGAQAGAGAGAQAIALTSQSITLPPETATLPASAEILTTNCTACHSPELILTQPKFDAKTWGSEVAKMRTAYKAAIDPKDDPAIVAALLVLPNQK